MSLIRAGDRFYAGRGLAVELKHTAYARDPTTIDPWFSLFPWARYYRATAAVNLSALLDLCENIPAFIPISDGTRHKANALDQNAFEEGSLSVRDRGFVDFGELYVLHRAQACFILPPKSNLRYRRRLCSNTLFLTITHSLSLYGTPCQPVTMSWLIILLRRLQPETEAPENAHQA